MAGQAPLKPARVQPVPPPLNSPQGRAMMEERAAAEVEARKQLPAWRRFFRRATMWLWLIFLGCVVMQIGLAGAGLLGDPEYARTTTSDFLTAHMDFVLILELLPVLILLAGFLGADRQAGIAGIAVFLLVGAQYGFIEAEGIVRSFHVLNALVIFTIAMLMTLARIPWRPHFLDAPPAAKQ